MVATPDGSEICDVQLSVTPTSGSTTVKATPLLPTPPTVTTTLPVVAPAGTAAVIEVALQFVVAAQVPLKVTVEVLRRRPEVRPRDRQPRSPPLPRSD